jgi:polyhydroxybutyrate depolymerase
MRGRQSLAAGLVLGFAGAACGESASTIAPIPEETTSSGVGGSGATSGAGGTTTTTGAGGSTSSTGGAPPIECPATPRVPGVHQETIAFGGHDRVYEVQVPIAYDNSGPVPLVFDMHGYTSNKDQQELVSGFSSLAEDEGFLVVRPQGFQNSWNGGDFCCGAAQNEGLDDVGLMKAIVTEVSETLCVDPKRVYATGISNGGALSHRIACEAADIFAAVAPVAYPLDFDPFSTCQPSRPIAVMHSHGTNDLIVPYNGSGAMPATPESFAYWGQVNGCTGNPVETYTKGNSHCDTYQSCGAGVEVTLCTVNGGHILYTNYDQVPIAALSWQFLKKHTLP